MTKMHYCTHTQWAIDSGDRTSRWYTVVLTLFDTKYCIAWV